MVSKFTHVYPRSLPKVLLNTFLPSIFAIAFNAMKFETDKSNVPALTDSDADPRVVEKLFFHEVHGRRYLGSKAFLEAPDCQLAVRLMLVAGETLRYLTSKWLQCLESTKKDSRCPLHVLFDPVNSPPAVALQRVAALLSDDTGGGRLRFLWQPVCDSFGSWCYLYFDQVRHVRHVLMSLSAWIYRRHIVYWDEFPWPLVVISDPDASSDLRENILRRWDSCSACCVRPGLARDLKNLGVTSRDLHPGSMLACEL